MPLGSLHRFDTVMDDLRDSGAKATLRSPWYGFGVHFKTGLPQIDDPGWSLCRPRNDCMQVEARRNEPQRLERWGFRYWLYRQQPMQWRFIDSRQQQVKKCLPGR